MTTMDENLFEQAQCRPVKTDIQPTEDVQVQVEDDRTGMTVETLRRAFADNLYYVQGKNEILATPHDYYMALTNTIRDRLLHRWINTASTYISKDVKNVKNQTAEKKKEHQKEKKQHNLGLY